MTRTVQVVIRDVSSGRFHKRWRIEGKAELLSFEACNADTAEDYVVVAEGDIEGDVPARDGSFCQRCFGADC